VSISGVCIQGFCIKDLPTPILVSPLWISNLKPVVSLLLFLDLSHILICVNFSDKGDLFVWGKNRSACLGLGHVLDQFFPYKVSIALNEGMNLNVVMHSFNQQIASPNQLLF
jgi:Regulator of chromosome condensation (RCC1) repeat